MSIDKHTGYLIHHACFLCMGGVELSGCCENEDIGNVAMGVGGKDGKSDERKK